MKIGYPCINRTIECQGDRTFRLKSYSARRLEETVAANLACLEKILRYNLDKRMLFFRITSDLVPFASHPVCTFPWQRRFREEFASLGRVIRKNAIRISMHPDQFTLINSIDEGVFGRSVKELIYHAEVLDLMGLGADAKIQIHVGGVYGDKASAVERFVKRYALLPDGVRRRLVIENDDRCYNAAECLEVSRMTGAPVLFDVFHDSVLGCGRDIKALLEDTSRTWRRSDGIPMIDYSLQKRSARPGTHADSIDQKAFSRFLKMTRPYDFDIMLEIKDKEKSALKAVAAASGDPRFLPQSRI